MATHILSGMRALWRPLSVTECGSAPDALTVLLAVVGSILLVGVALLAAWKLVVTVHDRREFSRFQNARSRARYEMVSRGLAGQRMGGASGAHRGEKY